MKKLGVFFVFLLVGILLFGSLGMVSACTNNYNAPSGCVAFSKTSCYLDSTSNCICYTTCSNAPLASGWNNGWYGNSYSPPSCDSSCSGILCGNTNGCGNTCSAGSGCCTPPLSNISGGDHCGQDWIISSNTEIAGNHTGIRNFIINPGITATVKAFNGTAFGFIEIHAQNIYLNGILDASGKGYIGGNGGNGGQAGICMSGVGAGLVGIVGNGPFGGAGGIGVSAPSVAATNGINGNNGLSGKYCNDITSNCVFNLDDKNITMGSGGGGGSGGSGAPGDCDGDSTVGSSGGAGGAGNFGGGIIKLYSSSSIILGGALLSNGKIYSTGNGSSGKTVWPLEAVPVGGLASQSGSSSGGASSFISLVDPWYSGKGGNGGAGAGGGILLNASRINITGTIDNRAGGNNATYGGVLKILCGTSGSLTGSFYTGKLVNSTQCGVYVPPFSLNKPYFSTLTAPNVTISSANVGDTVLLRFPGQGLDNRFINYSVSIYNSSGAVWWNPFSYFSKDWDNSQKLIGTAYEPYVLTQTELHKINASIAGTNQWNSSENLTVGSFTNNALPTAIITSPASDSKAQVGSLVEFNQASTDEDDLLEIKWDFGDGNITSCLNYSFGLDSAKCNIQHAYTNKGIYLVKLTAKEMNRAQSSQQMMLIYVFDSGVNVVPVISSPRFGISYGNFVDFNASGSYVANCSTSMSNSDFLVGNLNCSYLHSPNKAKDSPLNNYNLTFSWNMDGSSLVGNWSSYDSVVLFKYYFVNSGAHNSKLNLTYTTL